MLTILFTLKIALLIFWYWLCKTFLKPLVGYIEYCDKVSEMNKRERYGNRGQNND